MQPRRGLLQCGQGSPAREEFGQSLFAAVAGKGIACWRVWPGASRAPVLLLVGGDPSWVDATKPAFLTPNWQAQ